MEFTFGSCDALLMVGDSERDANLYYATRFRAPDPFVFLWTRKRRYLAVSDLELDRARAQADVDEVLALSRHEKALREQTREAPRLHQVVLAVLRELGLESLAVPPDFPLEAADYLRQQGHQLLVAPSPLFPERQRKSETEVAAIRQAMAAAEHAMEQALEVIRASEPREHVLWFQGEVLTSERVRGIIHHSLLTREYSAQHTIVAGGEAACDPHDEGHGPLPAGRPIVVDIFPKSMETGYFGDITRTVVRGDASGEVQALFEAVQRGQDLALGLVRAGADSAAIHQSVVDLFAREGYPTGEKDGHMQGFFHGTGHGLGLEIHEPPRIGTRGEVLQCGQVVTVEPGLYYPGLGGVRLEDVVVVREHGCENLTRYPKRLEP
jgi:Xaa-Pro aminopeptidase